MTIQFADALPIDWVVEIARRKFSVTSLIWIYVPALPPALAIKRPFFVGVKVFPTVCLLFQSKVYKSFKLLFICVSSAPTVVLLVLLPVIDSPLAMHL